MLGYFGLIALILLQAFLLFYKGVTPRGKKIFCVITGLEIAAVIGLRSVNVGIDTFVYAQEYLKIAATPFSSLFTSDIHFEHGFLIYNKLLSLINAHPQTLFITSALILISAVMLTMYRNTNLVWLSSIIYLSAVSDFNWALTATRQSTAVALTVFSFLMLQKRKPFAFVLLVLAAASFHKSAVIFLAFYPLSYFRFDIKNAAAAVMAMVLCFLSIDIIFRVLGGYAGIYGGYILEGSGLNYYTNIIIKLGLLLFPVAVLHLARVKADKSMNILLWTSLISLFFTVLTLRLDMFARLGLYFSIYTPVLIAKTFELVRPKKTYYVFLFCFLAMTFLFTRHALGNTARHDNFLPYEFVWDNPQMQRRWNFTDSYMDW